MRYGVSQTESFVILGHFWPFYHCSPPRLLIQKIKILKKRKKNPEDLIISQMRTKNDSHMMYGS